MLTVLGVLTPGVLDLQELKSFWLPSLAPESKAMVDKPDAATYCPATGKKLRLKDLTPVSLIMPCTLGSCSRGCIVKPEILHQRHQ